MSTARRSKRLRDSGPSPPIDEIAHGALEERLANVLRRLPAAAAAPIEDLKAVHDLRVATRRALAALDVFSDLTPSRRAAWLAKRLKRIRRAAGEARDLDVLSRQLRKLVAQQSGGRYDALLASADRLRGDCRRPIRQIGDKLADRHFQDRVESLLRRLRPRGALARSRSQSFERFARRKLGAAVDDFFAAADQPRDLAALHAFRIAAKRLRYAMELLSGAFPQKPCAALYRMVERLQMKLGQVNDHCAVLEILASWPDKADDIDLAGGLAALDRGERRSLERDRKRLLGWWTEERRERMATRFQALIGGKNSI